MKNLDSRLYAILKWEKGGQMSKILYNSKEISKKIKEIFSNLKSKKIVITAFVGSNADAYIPYDTKNLTIYCWPKEGITNPYVIEEYLKKKTIVYFVNKLHIKLYYCEGKGAVITSANLTDNALGGTGLYELGVYEEDFTAANIKKIIASFKEKKKITVNSNILKKLKNEYESFQRKNPEHAAKTIKPLQTFDKWYKNQNKKFKIVFFESYGVRLSKKSAEEIYEKFQIKKPYSVITNAIQKRYAKNNFVLTLSTTGRSAEWLFIDFITTQKDLVQLKKLDSRLNTPPFKIDSAFRNAIKKVCEIKDFSDAKIENLNKDFLKKLYAVYLRLKK